MSAQDAGCIVLPALSPLKSRDSPLTEDLRYKVETKKWQTTIGHAIDRIAMAEMTVFTRRLSFTGQHGHSDAVDARHEHKLLALQHVKRREK